MSNNNSKITVDDFMATNLLKFTPEQSIMEVMNVLIKNNISGAPVVDETGKLIGMISEGDCMKQISDSRYYNQPLGGDLIKDYMVTDVQTIESGTTIFEAANLFYTAKRKRFPVMKDKQLVGQISRRDVVKAVVQSKHQNYR